MNPSPAEAVGIKDYLPLLGVLLGAVLSIAGGYVSTLFVENRREKRESRNLAFAFKGELLALKKIVEERKYIEGLRHAIEVVRTTKQSYQIVIHVRREYFNVYAKNVDKIGTLNSPLPEWIATFYTLANSVLEDLESHRDGTFADFEPDALLSSYEELLRIFQGAMTLVERICNEIEKQYR